VDTCATFEASPSPCPCGERPRNESVRARSIEASLAATFAADRSATAAGEAHAVASKLIFVGRCVGVAAPSAGSAARGKLIPTAWAPTWAPSAPTHALGNVATGEVAAGDLGSGRRKLIVRSLSDLEVEDGELLGGRGLIDGGCVANETAAAVAGAAVAGAAAGAAAAASSLGAPKLTERRDVERAAVGASGAAEGAVAAGADARALAGGALAGGALVRSTVITSPHPAPQAWSSSAWRADSGRQPWSPCQRCRLQPCSRARSSSSRVRAMESWPPDTSSSRGAPAGSRSGARRRH
jgi:hypothetical protein